MRFFSLICVILILNSCDTGCGGNTQVNYPPAYLTEKEKANSLYTTGDSLLFIHSNGMRFYMTVETTYIAEGTRIRCSPPEEQQLIEYRRTFLSSLYPLYSIEIIEVPREAKVHISSIRVNDQTFYYRFNPDQTVTLDTITLDSAKYEIFSMSTFNSNPESKQGEIASIHYSPKYGILQIGKQNGEKSTRVW